MEEFGMRRIIYLFLIYLLIGTGSAADRMCAIKAGNLIDPEKGTIQKNQIILVEDGLIKEIGETVSISDGTKVIDLSDLFVLPGLVDAHDHLARASQRFIIGDPPAAKRNINQQF